MIELALAPDVLLWDGRSPALRARIEAKYTEALHDAFQERCSAYNDLATATDSLPRDALDRVVFAPRSARRLLWPRSGEGARSRRFLHRAVLAERAVLGLNDSESATGWTADCRAYVRSTDTIATQPTVVEGSIPLDLRSPHARSLDLMGGSRMARRIRSSPSAETEARTATRLEDAARRILMTSPAVADCVVAWTRVIVAQTDPSGQFWSGTNGEYVGRVMLVNAQLEQTSIEELADALVHEAIHGFLYMHESVEPWVLDFGLYTDEGAIESPWSGTLLPVRPFMQACFVWFGLATFWGQHLDGTIFDQQRARYLLARSLMGFRGGSLADRLRSTNAAVRPEMLDLIDQMQRTIRSLLA